MKNWFKRRWKLLLGLIVIIPILLFSITIAIVYFNQKKIVQFYLTEFNDDIHGKIVIGGSKIAPFKNFPYISIDLQNVKIFESKLDSDTVAVISLKDIYVGFNVFKLISGNTEIRSIILQNGNLNIVQDSSDNLNISKAFEATKPSDENSEAFNLNLQKIKITNVDIDKFNETNLVKINAYVKNSVFKLEMSDKHQLVHADADFVLTILEDQDTTFFKNKNSHIQTDFFFDIENLTLNFQPSTLSLEKANFTYEGFIDFRDDVMLDLKFSGDKPDFNLFLSFAPPELTPTLNRYANAGKVFFNATINGPSLNQLPHIEARFGCKETYIANQFNKKQIDQLQFNAFFTTGDSNTLQTMHFEMNDFEARPEAGRFKGKLTVTNFESPDIDMQIDSDFNLEFLTQFFELDNIFNLSGKIQLLMNFHDIIDLEHPEKSLNKANQAYYMKLLVDNLSFVSEDFHLPIKNITIAAETVNESVEIQKIDAKIGNSDILISGKLSNLPDILHHTDNDVKLDLTLSSNLLDLKDLTQSKEKPEDFIDDAVRQLKTHFTFIGSGKNVTEFKYLPKGKFILDELNASFKNYPHKLHDFNIDMAISDEKLSVNRFHGEIDDSDFDISVSLDNYGMFFYPETNGTTNVSYQINSNQIILKDLLTYDGTNYLSEDYQNEILSKLKLSGTGQFDFENNEVKSLDILLNQLQAKMQIHPLKFENFKGRIHVEDEHVVVESLSGKMGNSQFTSYVNYYYGDDAAVKKRDNLLKINAKRLDIDQLTNYEAPSPTDSVDHDDVFNIYELPFPDMRFELICNELNYHQYRIINVTTKLRTTQEHYLYIDQLDMDIANGHIAGKGYFDGRNKDKIYLNPDIEFKEIDLKKLMLNFDNFGQDELVSDNITGIISGKLSGKIRTHTDMIPIIDESVINIDFIVINGVIKNYAPFLALGDYFKDKNLNRIAFDTLTNALKVEKGVLTIPSMAINTSIGFLILEGSQDQDLNMNYLVRVPFKMVTDAASQKLFKRKKDEVDPEQEDDIIRQDPNKRTRFINVRVTGNPDEYKVSLERKAK